MSGLQPLSFCVLATWHDVVACVGRLLQPGGIKQGFAVGMRMSGGIISSMLDSGSMKVGVDRTRPETMSKGCCSKLRQLESTSKPHW